MLTLSIFFVFELCFSAVRLKSFKIKKGFVVIIVGVSLFKLSDRFGIHDVSYMRFLPFLLMELNLCYVILRYSCSDLFSRESSYFYDNFRKLFENCLFMRPLCSKVRSSLELLSRSQSQIQNCGFALVIACRFQV